MKKILSILLVLVMVLGLCACGDNNKQTDPTNDSTINTNDSTEPTGNVPELTDHENKMLDAAASLELPYPVMTWAIELDNAEQVAYYMDADISNVESISMTETAYDINSELAVNVFSVMFVKVKDGADANTIAQSIIDGMTFDRWGTATKDDVNIKYEVVNDCAVVVMLSKTETTYTIDDIVSAYVAALKGEEITVTPNQNNTGSGVETTTPDVNENETTPSSEVDSTESTESADNSESTGTTEATN